MYGAIAYIQLQPGVSFADLIAFDHLRHLPGIVASSVYRLNAIHETYVLAAILESPAVYHSMLASLEHNADYQQFLRFLVTPPVWTEADLTVDPENASPLFPLESER
jgi:hypothetical protein